MKMKFCYGDGCKKEVQFIDGSNPYFCEKCGKEMSIKVASIKAYIEPISTGAENELIAGRWYMNYKGGRYYLICPNVVYSGSTNVYDERMVLYANVDGGLFTMPVYEFKKSVLDAENNAIVRRFTLIDQ